MVAISLCFGVELRGKSFEFEFGGAKWLSDPTSHEKATVSCISTFPGYIIVTILLLCWPFADSKIEMNTSKDEHGTVSNSELAIAKF